MSLAVTQTISNFFEPTKEKLQGFMFLVILAIVAFGLFTLWFQLPGPGALRREISPEEVIFGSIFIGIFLPMFISLPLFPFSNFLLLIFYWYTLPCLLVGLRPKK